MTSYFPAVASNGSSPASSPLSPPASQRSTALSNRLTSVLSASYADSDIRDALETLSIRGIHNTAETRRQLRLDVQKEVVDSNAEIVRDFGKVAEQLQRIGSVISTLNQTCDEMRRHIGQAKQDTTPVLEEATALMTQKKDTETKQRLLDAFSKHFLVPEEDLMSLTAAEEPINERFFDILARVKQVHHDCEHLLGGENQRLGLEVMELCTRNLNSAYQKLYRWIQKEFQSLNLEDPRISSSIRRALRVLAERPSLFHSCLDFFAEARDYVLSDAFHYALTDAISGSSGAATGGDRTVKPIEFSAHDPLRYIGDMLAWVHSTTVSEREALEALFVADGEELARGIQAGLNSEPWSRIDEEEEVAFDGRKALSDLVNRDLTGVSRSLRQRVELIIQGHDDPITCYKVVNLLSFYRTTFTKLVGSQSSLVDLMQTLGKFTLGQFETLMRDQASTLSSDHLALAPPEDLSPPEFLLDSLEGLVSLMKTYDGSVGAENPSCDSNGDNPFTPVMRAAFDPFLTLARSSSDELEDTTAQAIYRTNILLAARATVVPFSFANATHNAPLSMALSTLQTNLLDIQHQFLLESSGLEVLLDALEPFSKTNKENGSEAETENGKAETAEQQKRSLADLATLPAFQPKSLITSSQKLDDFLPSALMDATDNLKRVQSASLVQSVTEDAVEAFCRDFEFVEGMIIAADEARGVTQISLASGGSVISGRSGRSTQRPETGAKDGDEGDSKEEQWSLRSLFPRTTGEIRVLLS
ncbi:Conserved oligomeric Golgi complex subunit 6 [Penicillium macrosclerotiorum]|uniref:Conserved oligomeric Golgi complex subunit 6 n=1 Tax=Penicillium macrosclerotiorum TaxID=303699 RepID=UPI00254947C1|nr:Conserved oligomeric Golgi complex subunit 6 [Penicillium macrosclerotiorum]KAJ5679706.1 Conserved oligomeric Golgi complex subunit 6 [Penicillium macrosclerotiorum]